MSRNLPTSCRATTEQMELSPASDLFQDTLPGTNCDSSTLIIVKVSEL